MPDWFETRFREPVERVRMDPAFAERVRALVVEEWQADDRDTWSDGTETDLAEGDIIMLDTQDRPTTAPPPAPSRGRRWPLVAAAALVLAVVAVGALVIGDDEREVDTAGESPGEAPPPASAGAVPMPYDDSFDEVGPGTYLIDPDKDPATPLRVEYEIAHEGWSSWPGAVKFDGRGHVALTATTVENLMTDACDDHTPADPPVGPTADDLATALAALEPFEVTSPPRAVTRYGYPGVHLQLTVPDIPVSGEQFTSCATGGKLQSWISPVLVGAFYGYNAEPGRVEDFWILDVDGTRVALITTTGPSSPTQNVGELEEILDSVRIVS